MTKLATEPDAWVESFERLVAERDDAPWLVALRRSAIERFSIQNPQSG